jgi:hypothetical protein
VGALGLVSGQESVEDDLQMILVWQIIVQSLIPLHVRSHMAAGLREIVLCGMGCSVDSDDEVYTIWRFVVRFLCGL